VAAENVRAITEITYISRSQQQNATGADVRGSNGELGLTHRPDQRRRAFLGEHFSDVFDLGLRQPGDTLHLVRCPLGDLRPDVVEAVDALADKLLVLPAILEDVPQHSVDSRNVSARSDTHVLCRMGRGARHPRIDDDHIGAVELLAFQDVLQRDRMRLRRVAAHDHNGPGIANIVVAVGHRPVAPGVAHTRDRGRVTDPRLVVGVVRSPERGQLAVQIRRLVGELGGAEPVNRVGTGFLADLQHFIADLVDRLVPGDPPPLTVYQLHGVAQPAVAYDVIANRGTLAAVRAPIDRAVIVRLLAGPDTVRDLTDHGAAHGAVGADVFVAGDGLARWRWLARFRFADSAERQRAEGRQTSGDKTRTAQKRATIDSVHRGAAGSRRNRFTSGRARSFDEHGSPLFRGVTVDAVKRPHLGGVGLVLGFALAAIAVRRRFGLGCTGRNGAGYCRCGAD